MDDDYMMILPGIAIGIIIGGLICGVCNLNNLILPQDVATDICNHISGNYSIEYRATIEDGKFVCLSPSYDNTQSIIFKKNSGDDGR